MQHSSMAELKFGESGGMALPGHSLDSWPCFPRDLMGRRGYDMRF